MTSSEPQTPSQWGMMLARAWGPRFPVNVEQIALEYSKRFDDPIRAVREADVGGRFEGALFPLEKRGGWAILYNPAIRSAGRINFTQAHEMGHYLCHRARSATGFECSEHRVMGFDRNEVQRAIEREADTFATYLLMPLDDFRKQVADQPISMDLLAHCAARYGVSLTAAALRWIEFTPRRAALVWADNGRVLWARRSTSAKKQGVYFPLGMDLPSQSVAASRTATADPKGEGVYVPAGVWQRREGVREFTLFADHYEATISLLLIDERESWARDEEPIEDTYDRFTRDR
ncbi:MAG: ImmA/IrrE family metallo-endopeptidase [Gammaproteobacteria bacterium]